MSTTVPSHTSIIRPRDFSDSTADTTRDLWDAGKMRHTLAALEGTLCLVEVHGQEGFAQLARLGNLRPTPGFGGYDVGLKYGEADGVHGERQVFHSLHRIGAIVPLEQPEAQRTAIRSYREEAHAAVMLAQREHGECEGRAWGKWSGMPLNDKVTVQYKPHTGNPHFADKWGERWTGSYPLARLREEVSA